MLLAFLISQTLFVNIIHCIKQPNIVLIVADDVGWNDLGFHGSNQIPTPNIDALAFNGVILNRFYTQPTCTPSRAALLTGYYPMKLGMQGIPITAGENRHLPWGIPTLPEKLQQLGYHTNLVGKWHLGAAYRNVTPTMRGFDTHFGYWNGYIGYFNYYAENGRFDGLDLHDNLKPDWSEQDNYATTVFTNKAEKVIQEHDTTKPLFLMVAHLAGHSGTKGTLEVPNVNEANRTFNYIEDPNRRLYAEIVSLLDTSVGRIVSALKRKRILDNTIIVFICDNGAQTFGLHENFGSNWPLRGLKFTIHEGGIRNSAIIYSHLIKKNKVVNNELFHISDWLPTLYAAAGGNVSSLGNIDGINQWDTIVHHKPTLRNNILLDIDQVAPTSGFIGENGRYKLIKGFGYNESYSYHYGDSGRDLFHTVPYSNFAVLNSDVNKAINRGLTPFNINIIRNQIDLSLLCNQDRGNITPCNVNNLCLFDLFTDPCETKNIASVYPNLVQKLTSRIAYYNEQFVPQKETFIDPNSNPIFYNHVWTTWLDTYES